MTLSLWTTSG